MDMSKYFTADQVMTDVAASDKWTLLGTMLDVLMQSPALRAQPEITKDIVQAALEQRDAQVAASVCNHGLAFMHVRIPGLKTPALAIAVPRQPVVMHCCENTGQQATAVCVMLVPELHPTMVLGVMTQVQKFWQDSAKQAAVIQTKDPRALHQVLASHVFSGDAPIYARDIMRAPLFSVHLDTPLRQVTQVMQQHHVDTCAVVDTQGKVVGQITCDELLTLGIPDFFKQLKSISFISEFDPLERYFEQESRQCARDVMSADFSTLPESATLLEVIFELAVRRHPKVFIVRDTKMVGVIDRVLLLDKILNL